MTRNAESLKDYFNDKKGLNIVEADVSNSQQLLKVMGSEFDIAFYLIHSMEGSTKGWKEFAEKDRISAENFAGIASKSGVKRIVCLSGLSHGNDEGFLRTFKKQKSGRRNIKNIHCKGDHIPSRYYFRTRGRFV